MIAKSTHQAVINNLSEESFGGSQVVPNTNSLMERLRHLGSGLHGLAAVLPVLQLLNGFTPKQASAQDIAELDATSPAVEVLVDSTAAALPAGRVDLEFNGDLVTARFGTKISKGPMRYGIETTRTISSDSDNQLMSELVSIGHGPLNVYLRSNNSDEHAIGMDVSADRLGRLSNVFMIPAWVHLNSKGTVLGYTFMAKAEVELGEAKVTGAVDYEVRNSNALSDKDSHAEYLAVVGRSIGASIGRDYERTVRSYLGFKAAPNLGGLLKVAYQPGSGDESDSKQATFTLCRNPVAGVFDPQGVVSNQGIFTIGEFAENSTHLTDDWALSEHGAVGSFSVERQNGATSFSPSAGFNFGGKRHFGIGAGARFTLGIAEWFCSASAHPLPSIFAEAKIESNGGSFFISHSF